MAKTTNKAQYERLYELMSERADLAQGYTKLPKEEVQNFWEKVKGELNSLGPPLKDASIWRKVWFDWKSYIKRKLVYNKKETKATGGGEYRQHSFSKLEEAVIELTGLKTSTAGIKNTHSFGTEITRQCPEVETNTQTEKQSPDNTAELIDVSMTSDGGVHLENVPRKVEDSANLLRQQIELQKSFYAKTEKFYESQSKLAEDVVYNTKRVYRALDKLSDIKERQVAETIRHNKVQEKLLEQKFDVNLDDLD
ncbi:uncharacterized protein LOC129947424 [Eupeodes corollae]|uniref:uncharacterized protein LOC129947424 n=1 Tax=Eupeodes corollae TaxID=290404 RepID=UPI002492BB18|nr:uncharacterized protein LOC129947424 [Eupeodes corollae]